MRPLIFKLTGYDRVQKLLRSQPTQDGPTFLFRAIEEFHIESQIHTSQTEPVRSAIFVCNHHSGLLDLLSIYPTLYRIAPNLKIVVNRQILKLEVLASLLVGVHPLSARLRNEEAMKTMGEHLAQGGNLLIFPAGKVGQMQAGRVTDFPWRLGSARLIKQQARWVVPVFVDAKNSRFFYVVRRLFPKLNMLFLLRTIAARRPEPVNAFIGQPIESAFYKDFSDLEIMKDLRHRVYQLKHQQEGHA